MATQQDDVSDAASRLGRVSLSSSASSSTGNLTEPKFSGPGKKGKKDSSRKGDGASNGHGNGAQSNGRSSKASSSGDVQICFDFTKGTCSRGENCRFSHDIATIVNVNSQERGICFDFVRGQCNRGLLCRFSHDLTNLNQAPPPVRTQKSGAICYDYVKGACSRGNDCRYSHDLNSIAGSIRVPGTTAEICYDFSRGRCTRGTACRYSHDARAAGVAVAPTVAAVPARSSSQSQGPAKKPIVIPVTSSAAEPQQQARSGSGAATQPLAPPQEQQQQQQQHPPPAAPATHTGGSRYADVLGSKSQPKPAAPAPPQQMEKAEPLPPPPPPPSQQQQHMLPPAAVLPPQQQPVRGAFGEVGVMNGSTGGQAAVGLRADPPAAAGLSYEYANGAHAAEQQQQQQQPLSLQLRGPPDGILLNSVPGSGIEHQQEQQMGDIAAGIGRMVDAGLEAAPQQQQQQQQQQMIGGSAGLAPAAPSGMPMGSVQQRPTSAQVARGLPPSQPFEYPQARAAPPPPPRPQQQQQQHASFGWGKDQVLSGGMERQQQQQRSASGPLLSAAGGSSAGQSASMDPVLPMSKAPSSNGLGLANGQFPSGAQTSAPGAGMGQPSWGVAGAPQMSNGMNQSTLGHLRQIWNRSG